jgi:hypothetical protein
MKTTPLLLRRLKRHADKYAFLVLLLLIVSLATGLVSVEQPVNKKAIAGITDEALIKRGEYLVSIMGCEDCHSPKKMGPQGPQIEVNLRFSGYPASRPLGKVDPDVIKNGWALFSPDLTAAVGPWGVSFAGNISSDATGIRNWTEAQFKKALTQGKLKGLDNTRSLLPPMPWQNYKSLKDDDVKAIFAFLKSTKPVKNVVPAPKQLKDI